MLFFLFFIIIIFFLCVCTYIYVMIKSVVTEYLYQFEYCKEM